jgi:hypothetical protein
MSRDTTVQLFGKTLDARRSTLGSSPFGCFPELTRESSASSDPVWGKSVFVSVEEGDGRSASTAHVWVVWSGSSDARTRFYLIKRGVRGGHTKGGANVAPAESTVSAGWKRESICSTLMCSGTDVEIHIGFGGSFIIHPRPLPHPAPLSHGPCSLLPSCSGLRPPAEPHPLCRPGRTGAGLQLHGFSGSVPSHLSVRKSQARSDPKQQ